MPRYRKIDVRIWNDKKFRELSDHGKLAFFLVLTHQDITPFGMLRARPVALAYELGWHQDAMSDAMSEVCQMGMVMMDEKAGLMVVPNFLKYNPPNGPNSLNSWAELIEMMPECPLRDQHLCRVKAFLDNLSEGMRKGINDALRDAMSDAMSRASHIQEQEQEQEQEKEEEKIEKKKSAPKVQTESGLNWPDDVPENIREEFIAYRPKGKQHRVTQRVIDLNKREAEKAGISLADALVYAMGREWIGFTASFYLNAEGKTTKGTRPKDNSPFVNPDHYGDVPF